MQIRRSHPHARRRSGAALLLSVLVLFVLIAIVFQISIGTMTDARIGRNDVGLTLIDRAIASAEWDVFETLKVDGEESADTGTDPAAMPSAGGGQAEPEPAADSHKDEWARPQRTEINKIELRIYVEAENAKYNVLNVLNEDEKEAEEAFQRVVRIIDLYREGTEDDISSRDADDMVREMKEYMLERNRTSWPKPKLLTFDEKRDGLFLPLSLRDFLVLKSWHEYYFRCYRDSNDVRVHSLDQFLTVWSSPGLASDLQSAGAPGNTPPQNEPPVSDPPLDPTPPPTENDPTAQDEGQEPASSGGSPGYGVNINLAPEAVLAGLFDERDVRRRFWSDVIDYRNLEEEKEDDSADTEPVYDEFNNEIIDRRAFETLGELSEVRSWDDNDPATQARIMGLLGTTSDVFSICITARRDMTAEGNLSAFDEPQERARAEEEPTGALMRTVRCVVWRRTGDDGVEIVPIVPWEVLDYSPFEVLDFPEDY